MTSNYKTNFDLSRDGRVYRSIPSNDIRLCSVCGCVIAHSAIQLHYNFAHPDWKPGVTMMAQQVREEKREQQNRERAARMLEERRRWEEHQRGEQQERQQQQQARDERRNQVEEALRTSREFRNAVAMQELEDAQNGVLREKRNSFIAESSDEFADADPAEVAKLLEEATSHARPTPAEKGRYYGTNYGI